METALFLRWRGDPPGRPRRSYRDTAERVDAAGARQREYGDVGEAIAYVNGRDRPLALYWFGKDAIARRRVLRETVAGGVTINDCLMHIAQEDQPFGGGGSSGMGAYHGEWGFRTVSKEKPVFVQSSLSAGGMLRPPYGAAFERVLRLFRLMT